jgi:hypothetical protein
MPHHTASEPQFPAVVLPGHGLRNGAGSAPCGSWPELCPTVTNNAHLMLNTDWATSGEMSDSMTEQVSGTLRELGFATTGCTKSYRKPYPEYFSLMPYPWGFRVPDFVKFTGEDSCTTYEHVERIHALPTSMWRGFMHYLRACGSVLSTSKQRRDK